MINNINIIFIHNIKLIYNIEKSIYYFRIQNYDLALRTSSKIINEVSDYIEKLFYEAEYFNDIIQIIVPNNFMEMLSSLLNAQESHDYILLADLYELQFLPFLYNLQDAYIRKESYAILKDYSKGNEINKFFLKNYQNSCKALYKTNPNIVAKLQEIPDPIILYNNDYEVEFTSSGLLTIAVSDNEKKFYMHSNRNALIEAFHLASSWYREDKDIYIVYGLGLGYHVKELIGINDCLQIEVYESDINIIRLALFYTDISIIFSTLNVKLIYDPNLDLLNKRIKIIDDNTEFVIHYPSLRNIKNPSMRENLEEYFIHYSSVKNQTKILNSNFKINILNYDSIVDTLNHTFYGKDLYIIAAGPSLDRNFINLKNIKNENAIILATGTVLKKLLSSEIIPDYVLVTEANHRAYGQIYGAKNNTIPLLFLSTAYHQFALKYQGKRYLICQQGYPKAEEFAKKHGYHLYQTGGSVSTTALDLGIQLGCKRIIFLGLDLAYTDNFVHAEGTSQRNVEKIEGLMTVTDINGKQIYTTKVLNIYRKWIENRIKDVKGIEFIDATEGGAKIEGMRIAKLSEII